jgi:hypothetical protein
MPTDEERRPAGNGAAFTTPRCHHYIAGLRRRRAATYRVEQLDCGCRDPWTCRHYDGGPSERLVDGYRDAVQHLDAAGLLAAPRIPEMQIMWRRGGDDQRLAREIAERWELAA